MSSDIALLEPTTRSLCHALFASWEEGMHTPVRATHTMRTRDEQLHLWAQGRMFADGVWKIVNPRHVVTRAQPGESPHNYGAAFDVCFHGHDPYLHQYEIENHVADPLWLMLGELGEKFGLVWGGRWPKLKDRAHFERADWRSLRGAAAGGRAD